MYIPNHYSELDQNLILETIEQYPFVSIVTLDEKGQVFVNHAPVLLKIEKGRQTLFGHLSKHNPQWRHFAKNSNVKIIVNGPNFYISPSWYKAGREVPTWNFVAIHLSGTIKLIEDFEGLKSILNSMTKHFETKMQSPWQFSLPSDLDSESVLTSAIVGFEFTIETVESKFKLNQKSAEVDKLSVIAELTELNNDNSRAIAKLMSENLLKENTLSTKPTALNFAVKTQSSEPRAGGIVSECEIRRLTLDDLDTYIEHLARHLPEPGINGIISQPFPQNEPIDKDRLKAKVNDKWLVMPGEGTWQVVWGLWYQGKIVGHLDLGGDSLLAVRHRAKLGLGIEKPFRSQGLGQKLMTEAVAWARQQDFLNWIDLNVFAHNEAAIRLYKSFGFYAIGKTPDCLRVSGQSIDDWHLVLNCRELDNSKHSKTL